MKQWEKAYEYLRVNPDENRSLRKLAKLLMMDMTAVAMGKKRLGLDKKRGEVQDYTAVPTLINPETTAMLTEEDMLFMLAKEGMLLDFCFFCGTPHLLREHHIVPQAWGGPDETVMLCRNCHTQIHRYLNEFKLLFNKHNCSFGKDFPVSNFQKYIKTRNLKLFSVSKWASRRRAKK